MCTNVIVKNCEISEDKKTESFKQKPTVNSDIMCRKAKKAGPGILH